VYCLQIIVRFLTDRYHGDEWPPCPARLFQALVAGGKTGAAGRDWNPDSEQALKWLEGLGAPEIFSRPVSQGRSYRLFVPNNSLDRDVRSTKTSKAVVPRIFSGHVAGEPDIIYRWALRDVNPARRHFHALEWLAAHVRALGWAVDFATAIVELGDAPSCAPGLEHYVPGGRGRQLLRVPSAGSLQDLTRCYEQFQRRIAPAGVNPYTRPRSFRFERYRRQQEIEMRHYAPFSLETPDGEPFAARWDQVAIVAAWIRHAAGEAMKSELSHPEAARSLGSNTSWIDSFVLGHTPNGSLGYRLSYIPVPSIGHRHSDGGVRRAIIVEPPHVHDRDQVVLDLLRIKLSGWTLTDGANHTPRAVLVPLEDTSRVLPFYVGRAQRWRTVTPVILHGHNGVRSTISLTKTDRLLRQAFEAAGYPESTLKDVSFQQAPYWSGSEAAPVMRVPRHLARWPRLHVQVVFQEPIQGPVLAGLGRHYGIGVFAQAE